MAKKTATFKVDKDCKHSRRYAAAKENSTGVATVYVARKIDGKDNPLVAQDEVKITIE